MFEDIFSYYQNETEEYNARFDREFDERWERWQSLHPNATEQEEAQALDRIYEETIAYMNR